jgi:hypothetical protein
MSSSYTVTESATFTVTHARHLAAKVKTDLKRMQRFYDSPSDTSIDAYEAEVVEFLRHGYLGTVTYGFRRDGNWIEPTLRYTARELAAANDSDDDPGKVRPGANVTDASFYSYLTYSAKWDALSATERAAFTETLSVKRHNAEQPSAQGYFIDDLMYSAGGRSLGRSSMRGY